jgi:hypothetical protein
MTEAAIHVLPSCRRAIYVARVLEGKLNLVSFVSFYLRFRISATITP